MFEPLLAFLSANPVLAGMGTATVAGFLLANAKSLPSSIYHLIKDQFSTEITIWSEHPVFEAFDFWLSTQPSVKKMRRLAIADNYANPNLDVVEPSRGGEPKTFAITAGAGAHIIWRGSRPFFIYREIVKPEGQKTRSQTITVTTPGRSQEAIRTLFADVHKLRKGGNTTSIYVWDGYQGHLIDQRPYRPFSTIYCDEALKEDLRADINKFIASRDIYRQKGIPWRRTYLLDGKPGTGKTTMIFALASMLQRPILIVQANAISNDRELINALNPGGEYIIVVEEIDTLVASESRDLQTPGARNSALGIGVGIDTMKSGVTLAGLLEALDGLSAKEGRILFVTSNKPEILDSALMRPGRIDVRKSFELATEEQALAMFNGFCPNQDPQHFLATIKPQLPIAHAELQSFLLANYT